MDQKELRFTRGEVEALLHAISDAFAKNEDMAPEFVVDLGWLASAQTKLADELARLA